MTQLKVIHGDITTIACDIIVNAANNGLQGGGGVDGAIHQAGGPAIMEECREIGYCPTGSAVITSAGDIPADYIIHTVGPVWMGGTRGEAEKLQSCYEKSIELAVEYRLIVWLFLI